MSWFPSAVSKPIQDISIVRVVAAHINDRDFSKYVKVRNAALFGTPERWIRFPYEENRDLTEKSETKRLASARPKGPGRRRSQEAATRYFAAHFRDWYKSHPSAKLERQDVRWTVQCLVEDRIKKGSHPCDELQPPGFFNELLYLLYAMNLDVFGDKASRDLYAFDVTPADSFKVDFRIIVPADVCRVPPTGTARLRLYVLMRQLAYPPAFNPERTWFSPAIMIAAVISPILTETSEETSPMRCDIPVAADWNERKRRIDDVIMASLDIEQVEVRSQGYSDKFETLDDFSARLASKHLENLVPAIRQNSLRRLMLTPFTAVVMDISDKHLSQLMLQRPGKHPSRWRRLLLHYITCLCYPKFGICKNSKDLWNSQRRKLRCEDEFRNMTLKRLVKNYLPTSSSWSIRDDTISVNSPGRRVLLRSVNERVLLQDQGPRGEYNQRRILGAVAWNILLLSLIGGQEASLERFHSELPKPSGIAVVRDGLRNFDDFYDVDLFELPTSSAYRDAFDALQESIRLNHQYEVLHKKLEVSVSEIHASALVWAVVSFVFLALFTILPNDSSKYVIVAALFVCALTTVVVLPTRRLWVDWIDAAASRVVYLPDLLFTWWKNS